MCYKNLSPKTQFCKSILHLLTVQQKFQCLIALERISKMFKCKRILCLRYATMEFIMHWVERNQYRSPRLWPPFYGTHTVYSITLLATLKRENDNPHMLQSTFDSNKKGNCQKKQQIVKTETRFYPGNAAYHKLMATVAKLHKFKIDFRTHPSSLQIYDYVGITTCLETSKESSAFWGSWKW